MLFNENSEWRTFWTTLLCGVNLQVKQQQQRVLQTLEVKRIPFETRNIAVDQEAKRDFRRLMRIHDPRATTPQIFNGDTHCGVKLRHAPQSLARTTFSFG